MMLHIIYCTSGSAVAQKPLFIPLYHIREMLFMYTKFHQKLTRVVNC